MKIRSTIIFIFQLLMFDMFAQDQVAVRDAEQQSSTTYAFIIGIAHYPYINPPLNYADLDAELFKYYVQSANGGNAREENIKMLLNEEAEQGSIVAAMREWLSTRPYKAGDRLYVYLAGHGDAIDSVNEEFYLLAYNCSLGANGAKNNYLAGGAFQINNLQNRLRRIAEKEVEVIFIMDACRTNELYNNQKDVFEPVDKNAVSILSAQPGKISVEDIAYGGGHGLFTWFLIDGLMRGDPKGKSQLSLLDIEYYVAEKIRAIDHDQQPMFSSRRSHMEPMFRIDTIVAKDWLKIVSTPNFSLNDAKPRSITGEISRGDSALQKVYNEFSLALNENRLGRAANCYTEMERSFKGFPLVRDAKESLIATYINIAQGKINNYLDGKDRSRLGSNNSGSVIRKSKWEMRNEYISTLSFADAAEMMFHALSLLEESEKNIIDKDLWAKYYFLQAMTGLDDKLYSPRSFNIFTSNFIDQKAETALDFCNKALELQPAAAYIFNCRGLLLSKKGPQYAKLDFFKAIELNPKWTYPYNALSVIYADESKMDSAEYYLNKAIAIDPGFEIGYFNLGILQYRQNDLVKGYNSFVRALDAYPSFGEAAYYTGLLLLDSAAKKTRLNNAVADSAINYFRLANKLNEDIQVFTSLEYIYYLKGDKMRSDTFANKADQFFRAKKYAWPSLTETEFQKGVGFYKRLIETGRAKPRDYYSLAGLYKSRNNKDSVLKYFKASIIADSTFIEGYMALGEYMLDMGETDLNQVLNYYLDAFRLIPREDRGDYCIEMGLADVYSRMNKVSESLSYVRKAFKNRCFDETRAIRTQHSLFFKLFYSKKLIQGRRAKMQLRCPLVY